MRMRMRIQYPGFFLTLDPGSGMKNRDLQVLRGVVRVELVETPDDYIPAVLERVKTKYIERTYK
jgi:hypothetical protein